MTKLLSLLIFFASAVIPASAQIQIDSATISLTSTGTTILTGTNGNSSSGSLKGVACLYISKSGQPTATVDIKLNNITLTSYQIADGINQWTTATYQYRFTEDNIFLPLEEGYTNGLYVAIHITAAASGGQIACSSIHT